MPCSFDIFYADLFKEIFKNRGWIRNSYTKVRDIEASAGRIEVVLFKRETLCGIPEAVKHF